MGWRSDNSHFLDGRVVAAASLVEDLRYGTKFGRNQDVDAAEDIWPLGGDYTGQPITAGGQVLGVEENFEIISTSANDAAAGTGARTVGFTYLDDAGDWQEGSVTLNGTTGVDTGVSGVRCFRAKCTSFGSGATNAGDITIRHITTTSNIFVDIAAGVGQSELAAMTVPAGHIGVFFDLEAKIDGSNGAIVDVAFRVRENGVGGYLRQNIIRGREAAQGPTDSGLIRLPALSDIKMRVESTSAANMDVAGQFNFAILRQ